MGDKYPLELDGCQTKPSFTHIHSRQETEVVKKKSVLTCIYIFLIVLPDNKWKASLMSAKDLAKYPPAISTAKKHKHRTVTKISLRLFLVDSFVISTPLQAIGGGVEPRSGGELGSCG